MKKYSLVFIFAMALMPLGAQANYWPLSYVDFTKTENPLTESIHFSYINGTIAEAMEEDRWGYHPRAFYPVGWSEDGKFAYVIVESASERGWSPMILCIMDMISDEMVYEQRVDDDEEMMGAETKNPIYPPNGVIKSSIDVYQRWKGIAAEYEQELSRLGIGKISTADFIPFPAVIDGETYHARPFGQEKDDGESHSPYLSEYGIRIEKASAGSKVIFKGECLSTASSPAIGITVFGAFKSPYENRIAVLYGLWDTGWEGTPWLDLHLSGSHLGAGFR